MTTQMRKIGSAADTVREIAVRPDVRALSMLSRVDYADAFLAEITINEDRTAEQWARAMVEDVPMRTRRTLRWGWLALGLKLGTPSDQTVVGWEPQRSTPDIALYGRDSRIGMPAEVLFKRHDEHTLLFATFVQLGNPLVRALWAGIAPGHRRVVQRLLGRAVRSERQTHPSRL